MPRQRKYASEFQARDARARAEGWRSFNERRYWRGRLTDPYVRELAEEIGGPVEPEREGSLMSRQANAVVNARDDARPWDWRVRLLVASGRIKRGRRRN